MEHSLPDSDIEIVSTMWYEREGSSTDIAAPNKDKIQPRDGALAVTDQSHPKEMPMTQTRN